MARKKLTGDQLTGNSKDKGAEIIEGAPRKAGWKYRGAKLDVPETFIAPSGKQYRWARPRERADLIVQLKYSVSPGRLREILPARRKRRKKTRKS